jgi:predicted nicotinamide N-methyase
MYKPSGQFLEFYAPIGITDYCNPVQIHQTSDFFKLWENLEKEAGQICDVPFWAIAWPAARALSLFISAHPEMFRDKAVLDFGCGCGIAGITAAKQGGIVTLNDIDPLATYVASINCQINTVSCTISAENLLSDSTPHSFDIILIADCFYQKTISDQILSYLLRQFKNGSKIFIADGHRPFTPRQNCSMLETVTLKVDYSIEGVTEREVDLLQFCG